MTTIQNNDNLFWVVWSRQVVLTSKQNQLLSGLLEGMQLVDFSRSKWSLF